MSVVCSLWGQGHPSHDSLLLPHAPGILWPILTTVKWTWTRPKAHSQMIHSHAESLCSEILQSWDTAVCCISQDSGVILDSQLTEMNVDFHVYGPLMSKTPSQAHTHLYSCLYGDFYRHNVLPSSLPKPEPSQLTPSVKCNPQPNPDINPIITSNLKQHLNPPSVLSIYRANNMVTLC